MWVSREVGPKALLRLSLGLSGFALAGLLLGVPMLHSSLLQLEADFHGEWLEVKGLTTELWASVMAARARLPRSAPLPNSAPYAFASDYRHTGCQCSLRAAVGCHPGPPGPPGRSGYDGVPGTVGLPGEEGRDAFAVLPVYEFSASIDAFGGPYFTESHGEVHCVPCPAGPPGHTGRSGRKGPSGKPGATGHHGRQGTGGKAGRPGLSGSPGLPGDPSHSYGRQGPPGRNAYKGGKGPPGPKGRPGLLGPLGPRGMYGFPGKPGGPGYHGYIGPHGPSGEDGLEGIPGKDGVGGGPGRDAKYCPCPMRELGPMYPPQPAPYDDHAYFYTTSTTEDPRGAYYRRSSYQIPYPYRDLGRDIYYPEGRFGHDDPERRLDNLPILPRRENESEETEAWPEAPDVPIYTATVEKSNVIYGDIGAEVKGQILPSDLKQEFSSDENPVKEQRMLPIKLLLKDQMKSVAKNAPNRLDKV